MFSMIIKEEKNNICIVLNLCYHSVKLLFAMFSEYSCLRIKLENFIFIILNFIANWIN